MQLEQEPLSWCDIKATSFYAHLLDCSARSAKLPWRHWLRLILHVPSTFSIDDLARILEQEDTVMVLSTVRACRLAPHRAGSPST